ncbi:methyl-accepting chemotaxis protein [Acetobacterium fimetarium]|uniref:Methyl-accepting chemotaxis protein n=1 Tax=Acetobacterium fimetarium TaxID=52691 RepID=A0ABR6WR79_9FIRM|nr:methyl-accepting chemotaxis protein [Acetobacterium fimetarium]MBC3803012.1 methyl-accepting chemotaxis protein [Acetobacterium fimetarium]
MMKSKSFVSKLLLTIGLPVAVVLIAAISVSLYVVNQTVSDGSELASVQNSMLLIFGIGLVITVLVIVFAAKGISHKIAHLAEMTGRLARGDIDVALNPEAQNAGDQLDELSIGLFAIAENIKYQSQAARKMADGDLAVEILPISDKDLLGNSLVSIRNSASRFKNDTAMLVDLAKKGIFDKSDEAKDLPGDFRTAILSANEVMKIIVDKIEWYEAILDAIPFPVHVIDNDMNWVFLNKTFADLMIANGVVKNRDEACGMPCGSANASICNSEACGIRRLVDQGLTDSYFEWVGRHNKQDTAYLTNKKGEKIGYVEIVTDLTSIISVSNYTNQEVKRLAHNLVKLAKGDLDFDMNIQAAGEYTAEVCAQFTEIGRDLELVKRSIGHLIDDAALITNAAIAGKLEERADETKFEGSWKTLIGDMNNILVEVAKPIREVAEVMDAISNGNLRVSVNGDYAGEFDELKHSVNNTANGLKIIVGEISDVTGKIGDGNLNIENVQSFGGDFIDISNALNTIIDSLNELLGEINEAAIQVNAGATQVADGSQSLAQGSTEQASSIQELTASITEIADQTKNNATDANKAQELSTNVKENAAIGNAQMTDMQNAMVEINQSSEDISKIIKVIDDIAFQTNILALNAAVEAARAGQHGKGFAVVAEEVRTLAARSAEAAKETTLMIEGSINKVQQGTKIADQTASALTDIVDGIAKVTDLVVNIAKASNEQATGISQVNTGIEQVAMVVQNNSATAEESAAASEELTGQAELLRETIGQFKLRKAGAKSTSRKSTTPAASKPERSAGHAQPQIILDGFDMDASDKY